MRQPVTAFIGLGANLGEAATAVNQAMQDIALLEGCTGVRCSGLYGSAPLESHGPDYVNAVLALQTCLSAPDLLRQLQALEQRAGRERPYPNAPRTLDLDLLLYGDATISSAALVVPHPRMWLRAFVLQPLAELAPDRVSSAQLAAVAGQSTWRFSSFGCR